MTDWNSLKTEYSNPNPEFKNYAELGRYKVKVDAAKVGTTTGGTPYVNFTFQETDEHKYPRSATHWISRKNIKWTKWHHCSLLMALGVSEANAQKAIDGVEKDGASLDQIVKGYQQIYDRACSRHPEVEIEVREQLDRDGNLVTSDNGTAYTEAEFTDRSVYSRQNKASGTTEASESTESSSDDDLDW